MRIGPNKGERDSERCRLTCSCGAVEPNNHQHRENCSSNIPVEIVSRAAPTWTFEVLGLTKNGGGALDPCPTFCQQSRFVCSLSVVLSVSPCPHPATAICSLGCICPHPSSIFYPFLRIRGSYKTTQVMCALRSGSSIHTPRRSPLQVWNSHIHPLSHLLVHHRPCLVVCNAA